MNGGHRTGAERAPVDSWPELLEQKAPQAHSRTQSWRRSSSCRTPTLLRGRATFRFIYPETGWTGSESPPRVGPRKG